MKVRSRRLQECGADAGVGGGDGGLDGIMNEGFATCCRSVDGERRLCGRSRWRLRHGWHQGLGGQGS